ncbi:transposase [Corynebacterium minutissimum]|nr:transposase [Corynebacterium minutissimum]VEG05295.1 transposase [Corynebacterium minutissimum]
MPRKYPVEFKEKAFYQIIDLVCLESCSLQRSYTKVGELLGVSHHSLRAWYRDSASVRDDSDASGGETMEE